jgi:hypothetical protein
MIGAMTTDCRHRRRVLHSLCLDEEYVERNYAKSPSLELLVFASPHLHCKKSFSIFPSPAVMSLIKLSLFGNNDVIYELFLPRGSLVSDIPAGDGKLVNLFLRCRYPYLRLRSSILVTPI